MVMVKPLSNAELEIMYLLWQEGTPLTAHQIWSACRKRAGKWKRF